MDNADVLNMTRREESASGISPEPIGKDVLLEDLRELFDAATADQQAASQQVKEKQAAEVEKAEEMRRQSVETMRDSNESRKRKQGEVKNVTEKKRNVGQKTFDKIKEKIRVDSDFKERELMLTQKAIEEKAKQRKITMERQTNEVDELRSTIEEIRERLDHQYRGA
eukprot:gene5515-biopygen501